MTTIRKHAMPRRCFSKAAASMKHLPQRLNVDHGMMRERRIAAHSSRRESLLLVTFLGVGGVQSVGSVALASDQEESLVDKPSLVETTTENDSALQFGSVEDDVLAYSFRYPTVTSSGRALSLVFSRRPERYSSAAPLSADARQRIVCELADLRNAVTVSLSVGPPSGTLRDGDPSNWTAMQVAQQVLVDRSTARVTSGQRVALNSIESAKLVKKGDGPRGYYVYEHISQGSPNLLSRSKETYRHSLAVTTTRPGLDGSPYLYTLNYSCPQELWDELIVGFEAGVDSFSLLPPGPSYVAPDQDPWRFF
jgi:hypothetical protein